MKKLNKLFAILVAMAMVLSLGVVSAFAADPVPTAKDFKLTKILEMPDGTTTPASTFSWTVTPVTEGTYAGSANAPAATAPTISFTQGAATTDADATDGKIEIVGTKTAADIFTGTYPAGKYVYLIKETPNTNTNDDQNTYTYSTTEYMVNMYVDAEGHKTYTLWTREDSTKEWAKDQLEDQVGSEDKIANADFTNTYVYTTKVTPNGNENTDNDATGYALEKYVAGDDGKLFTDTKFAFKVTATRPSLSTKQNYTYDIVKGDTKVKEDQTISATGSEATIELKTGERLVFKDLDVGAVINAKEVPNADFDISAKLNTSENYDATTGQDVKVAQTTKEYVKVTNTYNKGSTTPEGILISNLPYIALALVAIGGLVAYVVVRRKADDEA